MSDQNSSGNTAALRRNGPILVNGEITVVDEESGASSTNTRVALCRCGASQKKPFCDGSHAKIGFEDPGELGQFPEPVTELAPGGVEFTALKNGPVLTDGPLDIRDSSGAKSILCGKAALCRCGGSRNKPFCDGQHREIGFRSR